MALFQIQKGKASTLATKRPNTTEGYCYFTTDDGKFYIDIATATGVANRVVLNAYKADILRTARNLQVDLESTSYVSFDGSVDRKNIGVSGILGVANGGTGKSSHISNAVLTGNGASAVQNVATASGALYATATNGAPKFGTLPVAQGGTGLTANPSMLINLASNSAASVLAASPRPGVTGTLAVGNGGTGKTSWTANALIYAATTTSLGQIDLGTSGYVLQSNGSANAPSWVNATNANTASALVKRDASGNFSAGTITATLAGTATRAKYLETWKTDKSNTYGTSYPLYAWWKNSSVCQLIIDDYIVNVNTADTFSSAASITLTGDVTGTASSTKGWSITTTLANSGVTAGSYGPSANASPAHGGTFSVPYITFDAKGRATAASTKAITLPVYGAFTGASSSATGVAGLVPAPAKGAQGYFLRGDGTWYNFLDLNSTALDTISEIKTAWESADGTLKSTLENAIGKKVTTGSAEYIKGLSISGRTITYTKGDGTTGTLTTQDTDTNTHYTTKIYAGASGATSNSTSAVSNPYLTVVDDSTYRTQVRFSGSGATSVSANGGTITISSSNTTYSAGTGLSLSGTTFNHSNSITAGSVGTAQTPSHGGTFAIPKITYDAQGHITAATTVNITLPADNNTLNTAGSSNTSSKIFLVGATSQASSATTYSHDTAYVGTDGHLYSNSQKVLNATNYTDYAVPKIEGSSNGSYTVYRALGNIYKGGTAVTYYRIALPQATSWGMIMMKLAIRESYSTGSAGELIIYANHSSTAEWNTFYATCIGNLSTNIKVYGSDKKYLYIKGAYAYGGLSVELMTVGDSAANVNLSNVTIDTVTALPTTYQTAAMLYSLNSNNYTSYTVTKTGSGASGTWGISISGTAANASAVPWSGVTSKPSYYDAKAIKAITRSGTTFTYTCMDGTTGTFTQQDNNTTYTFTNKAATLSWGTAVTVATVGGTDITVKLPSNPNTDTNTAHAHTAGNGITLTGSGGTSGTTTIALSDSFTVSGTITAGKVVGAVWNDYAEYRWVLKNPDTDEPIESGRCVAENGNDSMSLTHDRLQPGARIISDTYGMCMGETEKAKTPIAVCGRVLAYPFERKVAFNVGDPVCSGPNGTVSKMSREEAMMYPERIVGTVVSKPTYKEWGPNKIPVNGRIWIQVR